MAQTKAIVDKLLTGASSAYIPEGYISEALLPEVKVKQSTGLLAKYGSNHLRIENTIVAGRGKARRVESIVRSTDSYSVDEHALEGLVTEADRENVEKPYDAERDEVIGLNTLLWLSKENGLASALTDPTVITQTVQLSGTSQFSDYANSDPLDRFKTARLTIRDAVGQPPDTAVMDWTVFNTLAYHPGILEALGFTQNRAGQLSEAELSKALGVKRLLIGMAQFDSATESQSESRSNVWGKHIVFCVAPDRAQTYQTSIGYQVTKLGSKPREVFKYNVDNPVNATGIIVRDRYDMFLSNVTAGYLIEDAIA